MNDAAIKNVSFKFIGEKAGRPAETMGIRPGVTVQDALNELGLAGGGYTLVNPTKRDQVFNGSSNLYALVEDGDMLSVSSLVDAGNEVTA